MGEGGVGKTTFIKRFATNKFQKNTLMTIGAGFYAFDCKVHADALKLQVWDFGGEQRFRFILPSYSAGAHAVVFAFDLTRPNTLSNLRNWYEIIKLSTNQPVILLLGTKADLDSVVDEAQITAFIERYQLPTNIYFRTSSKTGENVMQVFVTLASLLYKKFEEYEALQKPELITATS